MLNEQIKYFRNLAGYTQQQVAKMLNITQAGYSFYESGAREPNADILRKLCIIFDCSADELFRD